MPPDTRRHVIARAARQAAATEADVTALGTVNLLGHEPHRTPIGGSR